MKIALKFLISMSSNLNWKILQYKIEHDQRWIFLDKGIKCVIVLDFDLA